MKTKASIAVISMTLFAASMSDAAEPRIGKFVEYQVDDFHIVTSRSADQARDFVEGLAKFRVTLEKTLGRRAANIGIPTHILIVSHSDWVKYLQPRQNIAGWFHRGRFSNYMVMDGDAERDEALHVIFHEFTHFYLSSQFAGEYPPWFNEGLAELMGFAMFKDGMAVLRIPMYRVYEARDGDWIPFDRLIKVDMNSPEYVNHTLADSFYAQAWLTVHYGLVENREFGRQILEYLNQLNTLHPQDEATRNAFGADLASIDKQLRDYSHKSSLSSGAIKLGDTPTVTLSAGKPMAELDALAVIADLMIESRYAPDRIRPLVESFARREPKSARSSIFAARLAQYEDDSAGFERAVSQAESLLAPDDWMQRRELASVLLDSALDFSPMSTRTTEDSDRDLKRAVKWFGEAIAHNNQDVEALWGFGTAATRLNKNLDLADTALQAAYRIAPTSADVAVSLANVKGRKDEPDAMIPYLKDVIRYSSNLSVMQWAAETLAQTQKFLAERDRVEAQNKQQREDYEKRVAEYEKKYGKRVKPAGH